MCILVWCLVIKSELTHEVLHFPSTHPASLAVALMSTGFGLSRWCAARLAGVTVAQFTLCSAVVKSILWWLEQSWILPQFHSQLKL